MKEIGLVYDKRNKEARELALQISKWLDSGEHLPKVANFVCSSREALKKCDLVVTFGGDGIVWKVADKVLPFGAPILRVNFGTRGFMCNVPKNEVESALKKALAGNFSIKKVVRIQAKIDGKRRGDSMNEIYVGMVGVKHLPGWLDVEINSGGSKRNFRAIGNGLIFATPNGSTAWNNSAGGPQLLTDAFCVTASDARLESESGWLLPTTKSFVVLLDAQFEVRSLRWGKYLPYVSVNEEHSWRLKRGEKVVISKSPFETLFMELE